MREMLDAGVQSRELCQIIERLVTIMGNRHPTASISTISADTRDGQHPL
jgi:hypothetical protein